MNHSDHQSIDWRGQAVLLIMPLYLVSAVFILRGHAGPFSQWDLLDPAYFYLFDSLNLIAGNVPGHIAHPGVPVYSLGALMMHLSHFGDGADAIITAVIADPETYLARMSSLFIVMAGVGLWAVGRAAWRTFGGLLPAVACQLAPFMSTIVVKHMFLPRPESLVAFTTLLFLAVILSALRRRDGKSELEHRPLFFALAFGVVAGFGVSVKIIMAPVFILPLLLPGVRRMALPYMFISGAAFLIFALPAAGAATEFADYLSKMALGAGKYGSGAQTVIDPAAYPKTFIKILKRPSLKVPLALALITLALVYWQRRRNPTTETREARFLMAVTCAQLAQVTVVAKQAVAFYMIPSYMLSALSVVLSARLLWTLASARLPHRISGTHAGFAGLVIILTVQASGLMRLDAHVKNRLDHAQMTNNDTFKQCARIYEFAASSQMYALNLADRVTGFRFTERLRAVTPENDFWIDDWNTREPWILRNPDGPVALTALRQHYPCLYLRGNRINGLDKYLEREAPGLAYSKKCSTGDEPVYTIGVDCNGALLK